MVDILVSVILVVRNAEAHIAADIRLLSEILPRTAKDYEILIVDNASTDGTVAKLQQLADEFSNLQVYCLAARCELDVAGIVGLEHAIGDYVAVLDPRVDDPRQLPKLIENALADYDIVLARPRSSGQRRFFWYGVLSAAFVRAYRALSGVDLRLDTPRYRLMTRRTLNYVVQHENTLLVHHVLPALAGFKRKVIEYDRDDPGIDGARPTVRDGLAQAAALVFSTSAVPIRLVTLLCLGTALLSSVYSVYVVLTYALRRTVAPGWATLSLQISGLFFLLSIAIAIMAEYIVRISDVTTRKPLYYIAREFRSQTLTREQRLNLFEPASRRAP